MIDPIDHHRPATPMVSQKGFSFLIAPGKLFFNGELSCLDKFEGFTHHAGTVRRIYASAWDGKDTQPRSEFLSGGRSGLSQRRTEVSGFIFDLLLLSRSIRTSLGRS